MDIKDIERVLVTYGVAIRAIPARERKVLEAYHAKDFPNGRVEYLPAYKREMLVVERVPEHAGKFTFEVVGNTVSTVTFSGNRYYDSIEGVIAALLELEQGGN